MAAAVIGLLLGAALGAGIAWLLLGRRAPPPLRGSPATQLLPDPALGWLMRAHRARGVWITELLPEEEGPSAERVVDVERLGIAEIVAVDRRLERARDQEQSGAERMDAGTLVFRAASGVAVGLLLPEPPEPRALAQVEDDLQRLLEGVRRRPQIVALAQARPQDAAVESVGSVGLRLAYQLERILDCEVVVAVADRAGVRIAGVSGRADRRLLETPVGVDAPLALVATGRRDRMVVPDGDPLDGAVADRRQHGVPALVLPLLAGTEAVGAVALWLPGGEEPAGSALAELRSALDNAGPRLKRAADEQATHQQAFTDPLTGLANRRGLEREMARHGSQTGALVLLDFDKFKTLNDTLGHPAGDAALVHLSRILRQQIRGGDVAARLGGEEFALWLPGASLEVGVRIAERVRVKLGTTEWDWQGRRWPLSASFGVSACPETSRRPENLIAQADSALYVAKKGGRNRVEAAGGEPQAGWRR